jgi:hypothetical protein
MAQADAGGSEERGDVGSAGNFFLISVRLKIIRYKLADLELAGLSFVINFVRVVWLSVDFPLCYLTPRLIVSGECEYLCL